MRHWQLVALAALVPLLLTAAILWAGYQTDSGQRETSYARCVVNTRNTWADVQSDRADRDREDLLAAGESDAGRRYAHQLSADAHRQAAAEKFPSTRSTEQARAAFCRRTWPRLRFLGVF